MLERKLLKSRLARRFFSMFIACALVPIMALAVVTYYRATVQLKDQALERLHQLAKTHALFIYNHLLLSDQQLQIMQMNWHDNTGSFFKDLPTAVSARSRDLFDGLAVFCGQTESPAWGEGVPDACRPAIRRMQSDHIDSMMVTRVDFDGSPRVILVRRMQGSGIQSSYIAGVLKPTFLWGLDEGNILPAGFECCVWDSRGNGLFSSMGAPVRQSEYLGTNVGEMPNGRTQLEISHRTHYAGYWSVFLKPRFQVSHWTVMVLAPGSQVLQPLDHFRMTFPLILALAFLFVLWLSGRAIRKNLVPIDALMEGARKVAERRFEHRVVVQSNDEFNDLATAFNGMANDLQAYFKALTARADLDGKILSAVDTEQIVQACLMQSGTLFTCRTAAIGLLDTGGSLNGRLFMKDTQKQESPPMMVPVTLADCEHELLDNESWLQFDARDENMPEFLKTLKTPGIDTIIVLPIRIQQRLFAWFGLGVSGKGVQYADDRQRLHGFAGYLAVVFSNANLITELKRMNIGTLQALSRTVDAKSPWTAGHSGRVTNLAVKIAAAMGYNKIEINHLQRGGWLHDIGKIGVPREILDKAGPLTTEEYEIIKRHPSVGAQILSPIQAYASVIPIVEQHHERFDGKGYPHGLIGSQIHPIARIVALADTFDAMVSDRPYRKGLPAAKALAIIQSEAGRQFDPQVVDAFCRIFPMLKPVADHDDSGSSSASECDNASKSDSNQGEKGSGAGRSAA